MILNVPQYLKSILTMAASILFLFAVTAQGQTQRELNLLPVPSSVQIASGQLAIDRAFSVDVVGAKDASLEDGVHRFVETLSKKTGMPLSYRSGKATPPTLEIRTEHAREKIQKFGEDESYELVVSSSGAKLTAPTALGALHGLQTFLQLVEISPSGFVVPALTIQDRPRFPWRGTLIDVSRHFMPIDVLKRNIDGLAAVKMNVLHLHIYDDQGCRVESKRFPKLQELGSDGLYYTQAEIRDLVTYAYNRGVRIMPEFEMPGHSLCVLAAYPELGSAPGPYKVDPGAPDVAIDPTREETYKFLDKFLDEMTTLFPDAYFHIGGDEVNNKPWDSNPKIQAFMQAHGMKTNQDLQTYFNQRVQKILDKHHKMMVGWDEVLHPDLPKSVLVQSWRGQESLGTAAKQGYSGLLSFGYYIDLIWPAERHYAIDPMSGADALSAEEKTRILGGESCMWAEWISPETIDSRMWPRNAAIAERLWSPAAVKDVDSLYRRLDIVSADLELVGLTHNAAKPKMLRRMVDGDNDAPLRTLIDVLEPVKDYNRNSGEKIWDFRAPLNRAVDAASPESLPARRFRKLVQTYIDSGYKDLTAEQKIRQTLTDWRVNDAKLRPMLTKSFLLGELAPFSEDLSALGEAGLFALDYLHQGSTAPDAWRAQQAALFERAKASKANLLLMVVDPVQHLVEAGAAKTAEK